MIQYILFEFFKLSADVNLFLSFFFRIFLNLVLIPLSELQSERLSYSSSEQLCFLTPSKKNTTCVHLHTHFCIFTMCRLFWLIMFLFSSFFHPCIVFHCLSDIKSPSVALIVFEKCSINKEWFICCLVPALTEVFVGRHPADPLERNDGQQTGAHERANPREEKEEPHNCTLHGLGGCRIGKLQTWNQTV